MPAFWVWPVIFLFLLLFEISYIYVACRAGICDKSDNNRLCTATVTGGGVVFVVGASVGLAISDISCPLFLVGTLLVSAVSFVEDIKPQSVRLRLIIQVISVGLLVLQSGLGQSSAIAAFAFIFIGVGLLNAFNFMDGITGITGAYSIAVLLPLIYLNWCIGFVSESLLMCSLIAVIVFCFFNFRKNALCYAGDVGAISIGFVVLYALASLIQETGDWSYMALVCVYGVDFSLTLLLRIVRERIYLRLIGFHAYQIMAHGLSVGHRKVAVIYGGLQLVVSAGLFLLPVAKPVYLSVVVTLLAMAYVLFVFSNRRCLKKL